ncbi:MAG: PhaM family polyhydroxyalkanoate granule multifunctional regulatory protein, partial [Comamonas thiooxydans]
MSGDASAFGFGKFIPGFDFLQGLAQSAGAAANPMGRVPQWVAPTVSVEEVDKRIAELKAVQFWLEQNSRALTATIQALEVQRMTLSTLKDMNVSMSELAKSFPFPGAAPAEPAATGNTGWPMGAATAAPAAE